MKKVIHPLLKEFDEVIAEAPVDFIGTGSTESGRIIEESWDSSIESFRENLKEFIDKYEK